MTFDSRRGVCVVFGGVDDKVVPLTALEEYDGGFWRPRTEPGPQASIGNAIAYDIARGVTVLFGVGASTGETWEWDGSAWSLQDLGGGPGSFIARMVFDNERAVCVLPSVETRGVVWEWDGQGWSFTSHSNAPELRVRHGLAYDSVRHRVVMFGGGQFPSGPLFNDTWEYGLYPDCDFSTGAGSLDIFDFLCFLNKFAAQEPYACDCDTATGQGVCDVFDFMCFQNLFGACP